MIYTVKGLSVVSEAEVEVREGIFKFYTFPCYLIFSMNLYFYLISKYGEKLRKQKKEKKPLYMRSCSSEFNLWIPFSVEVLAFMSHQTQVCIDSVMSSSVVLCHLSYVACFQSLSCLCFLWASEWHCPVFWTGIIWFPFYRWKDWSLRKTGDLSEVTCSLPMTFRTRSQVQCSFNPCRKNLAIYFEH